MVTLSTIQRRAAEFVDTVATLKGRPGPKTTEYVTVLETGRLYKWTLDDATTTNDLNVIGHTGGLAGRWIAQAALGASAPTEGANLTNADATITVLEGDARTLPAATLTANRVLTLGVTGAVDGSVIYIRRFDVTAYTLTINNGGSGAGTLRVMPKSATDWAVFRFNGTDWVLSHASGAVPSGGEVSTDVGYRLAGDDPDADFKWTTATYANLQGDPNHVASWGWNVAAGAGRESNAEPAGMWTVESDFWINGSGDPGARYMEAHCQFIDTSGNNHRPFSISFDRVSNTIVNTQIQGRFNIIRETAPNWVRMDIQDGTGRGNVFCGQNGGEGLTFVFDVNNINMIESRNGAGTAYHQVLRYDNEDQVVLGAGFASAIYSQGPFRLKSFTTAQLQALTGASTRAGIVAYCSNGDSGSPCLAVSNGTNWLRVPLGAAISAT